MESDSQLAYEWHPVCYRSLIVIADKHSRCLLIQDRIYTFRCSVFAIVCKASGYAVGIPHKIAVYICIYMLLAKITFDI